MGRENNPNGLGPESDIEHKIKERIGEKTKQYAKNQTKKTARNFGNAVGRGVKSSVTPLAKNAGRGVAKASRFISKKAARGIATAGRFITGALIKAVQVIVQGVVNITIAIISLLGPFMGVILLIIAGLIVAGLLVSGVIEIVRHIKEALDKDGSPQSVTQFLNTSDMSKSIQDVEKALAATGVDLEALKISHNELLKYINSERVSYNHIVWTSSETSEVKNIESKIYEKAFSDKSYDYNNSSEKTSLDAIKQSANSSEIEARSNNETNRYAKYYEYSSALKNMGDSVSNPVKYDKEANEYFSNNEPYTTQDSDLLKRNKNIALLRKDETYLNGSNLGFYNGLYRPNDLGDTELVGMIYPYSLSKYVPINIKIATQNANFALDVAKKAQPVIKIRRYNMDKELDVKYVMKVITTEKNYGTSSEYSNGVKTDNITGTQTITTYEYDFPEGSQSYLTSDDLKVPPMTVYKQGVCTGDIVSTITTITYQQKDIRKTVPNFSYNVVYAETWDKIESFEYDKVFRVERTGQLGVIYHGSNGDVSLNKAMIAIVPEVAIKNVDKKEKYKDEEGKLLYKDDISTIIKKYYYQDEKSPQTAYMYERKDLQFAFTLIDQIIKDVNNNANLMNQLSLNCSGYIWPVDQNQFKYVTSSFGLRILSGSISNHTGIDIAVPTGASVFSVAKGKVVKAINGTTGYGNYIIIQNDDGKYSLYGHNSQLLVKEGDSVTQGQIIARAGSTGHSTGPHLHFEMRITETGGSGKLIDPIESYNFVKTGPQPPVGYPGEQSYYFVSLKGSCYGNYASGEFPQLGPAKYMYSAEEIVEWNTNFKLAETMAKLAQPIQAIDSNHRLFATIVAGQAVHEAGGPSELALKANNWGGIKCTCGTPITRTGVIEKCNEAPSSTSFRTGYHYVSTNGVKWVVYPKGLDNYVVGRKRFLISNSRYENALRASTPEDQIYEILQAGYCEGIGPKYANSTPSRESNYYKTVVSYVNKLRQYDYNFVMR